MSVENTASFAVPSEIKSSNETVLSIMSQKSVSVSDMPRFLFLRKCLSQNFWRDTRYCSHAVLQLWKFNSFPAQKFGPSCSGSVTRVIAWLSRIRFPAVGVACQVSEPHAEGSATNGRDVLPCLGEQVAWLRSWKRPYYELRGVYITDVYCRICGQRGAPTRRLRHGSRLGDTSRILVTVGYPLV